MKEMTFKITSLFIYPVKSLGGISLQNTELTSMGMKYDRNWMLIDKDNRAVTQRDFSKLSTLKTELEQEGILVKSSNSEIIIPYCKNSENSHRAGLWRSKIVVNEINREINHWFSEFLSSEVSLVKTAENAARKAGNTGNRVKFHDSDQLLILGQSSVDNLNSKLENKIDFSRFRPNIVFDGNEPHKEDNWENVIVGSAHLARRKKCSRCRVINIDQTTGNDFKEPLKTLAAYRKEGNHVHFGSYYNCLNYSKMPKISVGDAILESTGD